MILSICVNFDETVQDPSLAVALYSSFENDNWETDEKIPFFFWKKFSEPKEFIEKQIEAIITAIAGAADVYPFPYVTVFSDDYPQIRKSN